MKINWAASTTGILTAVSIRGSWIKLIQTRPGVKGAASLLGVKARQVFDAGEESLAGALQGLVRALPEPPREVVGLFSTDTVLTRYLSLPSQDPAELQAMALFQLEGLLPYPVQECVVSVKALGAVGEATRVFVAVAHKPEVERFLRICQRAGLRVTELAASSEAIGRWHQACWPEGLSGSAAWLAVEFTQEGLDLGILAGSNLIYMRHVPNVSADLEDLTGRIEETIKAYQKEQIGPAIGRVSVSGWFDPLGPGFVERLETALGLPVHRVDPLEASPFKDTLAVTLHDVAPEISFSDLLGVVCAPRLLELDLLPLETQWEQARSSFFREGRRTAGGMVLCAALVLGWLGLKVGMTVGSLRQTQRETRLLEPQVERIKQMAQIIREIHATRELYIRQMRLLESATQHRSPGMTLQFLGLEGGQALVLRGSAPDLNVINQYAAVLQQDPLWREVNLRSARAPAESSGVEFELVLSPPPEGTKK